MIQELEKSEATAGGSHVQDNVDSRGLLLKMEAKAAELGN